MEITLLHMKYDSYCLNTNQVALLRHITTWKKQLLHYN